jgi:O-antigen ligase
MPFTRDSFWKGLVVLLVWATITIALPWRWCRSVYEIGLFALAAVIFWRCREEPRRLLNGVLLLLVPAVIGMAQLASGTTVNRLETSEAVVAWLASFAAAFVARQTLVHTGLRHHFLTAAGLAGGLAALACVLQLPLHGTSIMGLFIVPDFDTFAGPFQNRNTYCSFAELILPVAIWKAIASKRNGWFWWGVSAIITASVVASGSRAGSLLILCELGTLLLIQIRARILFPLTGMAIAVMATGWDTLADRLSQEDWSSHRRQLYSSSIEMIAERPLIGHGLGTFESAYPRFARFDLDRRVNHAHNDWLEWTAEGGALLPASLLVFFALAAWHARRHLWSWGIAFVLAHAVVDYPLQRAGMSGWFWALGGTVLAAASIEKGNPRRRSSRKHRRSTANGEEPVSPQVHPVPTESTDQSLATAGH